MSGKGGSPSPPGRPAQDCSTLAFRTYLASPQPGSIDQLRPGEILAIELDLSGQFPVVTVRDGDTPIGAIAEGQVGTILRCLQEGFQYEAEVLTIEGGRVNLQIRPAPA